MRPLILWGILVLFRTQNSNAEIHPDYLLLRILRERVSEIKCDIDKPDFELPSFPDWNPNLATPQQICTVYLDGPQEVSPFINEGLAHIQRYRSFQGFCAQTVYLIEGEEKRIRYINDVWYFQIDPVHQLAYQESSFTPIVAFAPELPGQHNLLQDPRIALYCRDHCYCKYPQPARDLNTRTLYDPLIEATGRSRGHNRENGVYLSPAHETRRISIDRRRDWDDPIDPQDNSKVLSTSVWQLRPFWAHPAPGSIYKRNIISLNPRNMIDCRQSPVSSTVPIPPPYTRDDFPRRDLKGFCAVALSGGNPEANAGGYCHHPTRNADPPGEVWFTDTMTPRPEWRFAYDFRTSLQTRYFCWLHCWCADYGPPERPSRMIEVWNIMGALQFISTEAGLTTIMPKRSKRLRGKAHGADKGQSNSKYLHLRPASVIITPPEWNGKPVSERTCIIRGVDYCKPEPWPVDILGPIPNTSDSLDEEDDGDNEQEDLVEDTQESLEESPNPDLVANDIPLCGQVCSGPAITTCSGGQEDGCECALAPPSFAKRLGLDPVAPVALCLNFLALYTARLRSKCYGSLNGRGLEQADVEQDDEELAELLEAACPCNSSYVSRGCCGSESGLIWEDPTLKIGELAVSGELKT